MGYLAYEAATLLDGHPAPEPGDAPCPPIGLLVIDRAVVFDHWRQRLILVAHVPRGRLRRGRARRSRSSPRGSRRPRRPPLAPVGPGDGPPADGRGQHARRGLPGDRVGVQGAHPRRGHLPGGAVAPGDVRRARRRLPHLPAPARHEPGAVHVLRADARDGARRVVARAARSRRGPARVGAADRRDPAARADRDARPAPRARAARRPEGAGRARDARGPGSQRPRPGVRRRARSGRPS